MSTTIHVGNIAAATTEDQLRTLFAADGREVKSVSFATDRATGERRAFAFIEMAVQEQAAAAIAAVNGQEVDGQRLRVSEAKPRAERTQP